VEALVLQEVVYFAVRHFLVKPANEDGLLVPVSESALIFATIAAISSAATTTK